MFDDTRYPSQTKPADERKPPIIIQDYFWQFDALAKKNGFNTDYQFDPESGRVTAHALRARGFFGGSGDIVAFVESEAECAKGLDNLLDYNRGKPIAKDVLKCEGLKILYNPACEKNIQALAKDLEGMVQPALPGYKVQILADNTF